jgi:hypothetical protein
MARESESGLSIEPMYSQDILLPPSSDWNEARAHSWGLRDYFQRPADRSRSDSDRRLASPEADGKGPRALAAVLGAGVRFR